MKKYFNSWKDIRVGFDDKKERWVVHLTPLGLTPGRPSFKTKPEAIEAAQEAFERYSNPDYQPASSHPPAAPKTAYKDITLGEAFQNFLAYDLSRAENPDVKYSIGSYGNIENRVEVMARIKIGKRLASEMMLSEFDKTTLEKFWAQLRKGRTFRTADDYWQSLANTFKRAYKDGHAKANPCDLADRPRPDDNKQRIKNVIQAVAKVSMKNLVKIVEATPEEHRLKIIFACRTGLRQQEQIALKIFDETKALEGGIDFERNLILIRQAVKKARKVKDRFVGDPKTVSGIREIPIDADLSAQLKEYYENLPARQKGAGYLFPSRDGTMLDGSNLRDRVLYRACKKAGLDRELWPTWHELRHAFATHLLNYNKDWRRGMELIGHADIRTTLMYTHVVEDLERNEAEADALATTMNFEPAPDDQPSDDGIEADNVIQLKLAV